MESFIDGKIKELGELSYQKKLIEKGWVSFDDAPNTHSAIIVGEGFSAFIDGIPDKCDHDWEGDTILFSSKGKTIYWHTYRQWAHLITKVREELIYAYHDEIDDPITGGCTSCSKCNKPFTPPLW